MEIVTKYPKGDLNKEIPFSNVLIYFIDINIEKYLREVNTRLFLSNIQSTT